jgi:tetratricopeptide (TPR) repeat protein
MNTSPQQPNTTRMTIFAIALLAIPVLLIVFYFYERPSAPRMDQILESGGSFTELETMEKMWEHHQGHSPIALQLGNLYFEAGRYDAAIKFYREYLKVDTSSAGYEVRLDICRSLHELGKVDDALKELDTLLIRSPNHPGALYNYGAIEANAGHFDGARAHWKLLVEKHPQDSLAQFAARSLKMLDERAAKP